MTIEQRLVSSSLCYFIYEMPIMGDFVGPPGSAKNNKQMRKSILTALAFLSCEVLLGQSFDLQKEEVSLNYAQGKSAITKKFKNAKAGEFGDRTPGIMTKVVTSKKIIAL